MEAAVALREGAGDWSEREKIGMESGAGCDAEASGVVAGMSGSSMVGGWITGGGGGGGMAALSSRGGSDKGSGLPEDDVEVEVDGNASGNSPRPDILSAVSASWSRGFTGAGATGPQRSSKRESMGVNQAGGRTMK